MGLAAGCAPEVERDPADDVPDHHIEAIVAGGGDPVLALASGDTVHLGEEVVSFYRARGWKAAWTDASGFLGRGQRLVGVLHRADVQGLELTSYHNDAIHRLIDRAKHDVAQDLPVGDLLGNLDLLLTDAFLRYSTDLSRGTLDPREAAMDWRIAREDATQAEYLSALIEEGDLEAALAGLRPATPFYDRLIAALARYRRIEAAGGWRPIAQGESLEEGARGALVLQVRRRLSAEGDPFEAPLVNGAAEPALYDADLARAVEHFQRRHGIVPDGAVGAETRAAMNVAAEARVMAIKLNLDRWRWLPRELGEHFLLVNVAGQEMVVVRDHEIALAMDVIVGEVANKTPIFKDTLEYVVVNPYWNVPSSIAENEIWPKVARDPGYLARNDYEVVGSGAERRIRQRPGASNALGHVKFLFPNEMNVYLHDTPADNLFSRTSRAFSHGCIRVERPDELARYLFTHASDRGADDYQQLKARDSEQWVPLGEELPVYILYFTAWADEEGSTRFYPDIYRRDHAMERLARERFEDAPVGALAQTAPAA